MRNTILHILGYVLIFIGIALLIPVAVSYFYHEDASLFIILGMSVIITGLAIRHIFKREDSINFKTIILIVILGWIVTTCIGSLPYIFSGSIENPVDAFFESMSGFTTTGATILTDIEALPYSLLFWRSFTHWLGGMGIILLVIAILPSFGIQGMRLFQAEVSGGSINQKISPRIKKVAVTLWTVYLVLTGMEILLLMLGGLNLFDASVHTFGTVATGGFSSKNTSIGFYDSIYIQYVIIAFMFLAGINFILYCRFILGDRTAIAKNKEVWVYAGIILLFSAIITFDLWGKVYQGFEQAFRYALFHATSIVTTTGYIIADFDAWPSLAKMILFIGMFIGGCAGSTGSSVKVVRIYILVKSAFIGFFRAIHPSAVKNIYMEKEIIPHETIRKVMTFFVVYLFIFFVGSAIMSFFKLDMISAMSATAATLGNVGPGFGLIGATEPYTFLPSLAKIILSFFMLLGRLEIFTLFFIFTPAFWKS